MSHDEVDQDLLVAEWPRKVAPLDAGNDMRVRRAEESANDGRARFANSALAKEAADTLADALGMPRAKAQIAAFAPRSTRRVDFRLEGSSERDHPASTGH